MLVPAGALALAPATALARPGPPALFRHFPALATSIPHLPLGDFPTRVERVEGLLPATVELWVKREDEAGLPDLVDPVEGTTAGHGRTGARSYGGNKVRKLEFLLAAARARGARRIFTLGGYGSHHVLATALYGRKAGFSVDAVVFPQPITPHVIATFTRAAEAGCRYHAAGNYLGVPPRVLTCWLQAGSAYIAAGGSSPTGTLGWVSAGLELGEQVRAGECPAPDVVYVALGSMGTAAGLQLGLALAGLAARVVGVRVVDAIVCHRRGTIALARRTRALLESAGAGPLPLASIEAALQRFSVDGGQFGGRYGRPTEPGLGAVALAREAGLELETTYTAKAFAALLADAKAGLLDGKRALFIQSYGGNPPPSMTSLLQQGVQHGAGPAALPRPLVRLLGPKT